MKKTLLTLGAVAGFAAGAFAQGALTVENNAAVGGAGFNTASSNPGDTGPSDTYADFISGTVTMQIFSIAYSGAVASEATTINSDAASASTEQAAVALLTADGFTSQLWGPTAGTEALTQSFTVTGGTIESGAAVTEAIGSSGTLTSGSSVYYAILATYDNDGITDEGVLVLNEIPGGYGAGGGTFPTGSMNNIFPDQNLLLAPVPEPTTLALAGLGGLSMLFLRRRKS